MVVCHHNTIQHFIGVRDRLLGPLRAKYNRIQNCNPVYCLLHGSKLVLKEELAAAGGGGGEGAKGPPSPKHRKGKGKGKGKGKKG